MPALRIVGNISCGNEGQTDHLLTNGVFNMLLNRIGHPKKTIRREACWIVSNIAAGTKRQITELLGERQLMRQVAMIFHEDQIDVRKEACYVFSNMCLLGEKEVVLKTLYDAEAIEGAVFLISQNEDQRSIEVGLIALINMLKLGQKVHRDNPVLAYLGRIPGTYDRIEALQHHPNKEIYWHVAKII